MSDRRDGLSQRAIQSKVILHRFVIVIVCFVNLISDFFVFSDVRVTRASLSSPQAPPIKLNGKHANVSPIHRNSFDVVFVVGQEQRGVYALSLHGRRVIDASVDIVLDSMSSGVSVQTTVILPFLIF